MFPMLGTPRFGRGFRQPEFPWKDQKKNSTNHQLGTEDHQGLGLH